MAKRKQEYGNDSISMLEGADRVRKRPGVIFGSDGLEGCEHAVFEILSNAIDEAREGYGREIILTRFRDGRIQVEDFGRGCPDVADIDFLCGTFGKALASVGGYIVCSKTIRDYLINKMRTFIFTTALPPVNLLWTFFILEHLNSFSFRRERLKKISSLLKDALVKKGYACPSTSHILPMTIGDSGDTVLKADFLQRKGFYALPVRPPTVPEGTSRIRFSLTADITEEEIKSLIELI